MRFNNKVNYESKGAKAFFLIIELIGVLIITGIFIFVCRYGNAIFDGAILPLLVKFFCIYSTIDLWEMFIKNIYADVYSKTEQNVVEEKTFGEKNPDNDNDIMPHAPDFDE